MKLNDALANVTRLGLDTSPFIYFIERHPAYVDLMRETFKRIETGTPLACSSVVTLTEVLTQPLRQSNHLLAAKYRDQLLKGRNFTLYTVDSAIACRRVARELPLTHAGRFANRGRTGGRVRSVSVQ